MLCVANVTCFAMQDNDKEKQEINNGTTRVKIYIESLIELQKRQNAAIELLAVSQAVLAIRANTRG